jgi:hypothetical protein
MPWLILVLCESAAGEVSFLLPFSEYSREPIGRLSLRRRVEGQSAPSPCAWRIDRRRLLAVIGWTCVCGLILGAPVTSRAVEITSVTVLVKDADTGKPVPQAHLTLEFRQPGDPAKLKRSKFLSYSAKTNPQGRYRFVDIPKGAVRLIVTAERRQALSKNFEVNEDNPVLEVSLKRPQPLL